MAINGHRYLDDLDVNKQTNDVHFYVTTV